MSEQQAQIILSGDVGGTNTQLQLTQFIDGVAPEILGKASFKNSDFPHFNDIINDFLQKHRETKSERACFAFAGPIIDGEAKLTNLPWHVCEKELMELLGIPVRFINDFEAIGYGVATLQKQDYTVLQKGKTDNNGFKAIIGAGTGLGVALLQKINGRYHVIPTEGGHVDFAPINENQQALLAFMYKKFHRVSNERVVSGMGIVNIYKFIRQKKEFIGLEDPELQYLSSFNREFAADIARYATEHRDPICLQTLDMFVRCYGAVAGNLALTTLPYGGLYITGGIAPKLLPMLQDGRFQAAFVDKGRMSNLLKNIPIYVVLNTQIGLIGAAYYAAHLQKG